MLLAYVHNVMFPYEFQVNGYSKLDGAGISDEDYLHAKNVWTTFECNSIGDHNDLYNQTD